MDMSAESSDASQGAIQVICLGSGGGPSEDNLTAFLVRSRASGWTKGSILAVDAGSHLAAITRILSADLPLVSRPERRTDSDGNSVDELDLDDQDDDDAHSAQSSMRSISPTNLPVAPKPVYLTTGPFAGVPLPFQSARANAAHIVRNHVSTYLITHPHLDHLAGFAINTAAFHATSRPKRLAALPFTVDAIKKHIFNDIIWPNLTDEDGGVGFVTFQRLKEGGDVMVGVGEGRGYIEVCEGLSTKGFKVSHGKCMRGHVSGLSSQRGSVSHPVNDSSSAVQFGPRSYESQYHDFSHLSTSEASTSQHHALTAVSDGNHTVDSTVFFIRDISTSREILIFGDIEPDSVSLTSRLARLWAEAAPKVASGVLKGMFIECSYDDSQSDAVLFGHMAPRHLIDELRSLAEVVWEERAYKAAERANRKRKRTANGTSLSYSMPMGQDLFSMNQKRTRPFGGRSSISPFRRSSVPHHHHEPLLAQHMDLTRQTPSPTPPRATGMTPEFFGLSTATRKSSSESQPATPPLAGLRVVVIHVKDTLKDGPHVSERILGQLNRHAARLKNEGKELGCSFEICESGRDYWF